MQPGSYALTGSSQLGRDRTLAQNHGEDFPRDVGELETGCCVKEADGMFPASCLDSAGFLQLPHVPTSSVDGGCDGLSARHSSLAASCSQSKRMAFPSLSQ